MNTFIFLGPSLPLEEARQILPNAFYLPPVRCGEVLQILRFKPHAIGIIDGYFENTAAVWHKEILFALEQSIPVIGGSSMGALRASELAPFGMQVVGEIAKDYLSGILVDDDEVAILHQPSNLNYAPLTESMVNIRRTLNLAITQEIIHHQTASNLLSLAKKIFYQERTFDQVITRALKRSETQDHTDQILAFQAWLKKTGPFNLKQADAIAVLQTIASQKIASFKPTQTHKTAFFRALQKNVMCRPFSQFHTWLPIQEKVAQVSRYLESNYRLCRRLAYLLADCYGLAIQKKIIPSEAEIKILYDCPLFGLEQNATHYDMTEEEEKQFRLRFAKIRCFFLEEQNTRDEMPYQPTDYLLILLRLSDEYLHYKKQCLHNTHEELIRLLAQQDPLRYRLLSQFSNCWWLIEKHFYRTGLQLTEQTLQQHSNNFRITHKLFTPELIEKWIDENDLNWQDYLHLISANARLSILILQNNIDLLMDVALSEFSGWFLDALRLTDVYNQAKHLLGNPEILNKLKEKAKKENINLDAYARTLDFMGGEKEFLTLEY